MLMRKEKKNQLLAVTYKFKLKLHSTAGEAGSVICATFCEQMDHLLKVCSRTTS
jgi:hypothetical protein